MWLTIKNISEQNLLVGVSLLMFDDISNRDRIFIFGLI